KDNLMDENISSRRYRNRIIGDLLKELHLTEGRNTGFRKIRKALMMNGSPEPVFRTDDERSYFLTVLRIHPEAQVRAQVEAQVEKVIELTGTQIK
ncbi:MAG TPA: ATP-binding protein, partial [Methanomethylovorans sp.]|nr:ATP-binding protein [Methanomethylovorans sp.]